MEISLTPDQERRAALIGFTRQDLAVQRGARPRHRGGSLWGGHIEGACAELAAACAFGLPWTGAKVWDDPPSVRVPDLGEKTEVRWAERVPVLNYDAERDDDSRVYVLVTGTAPSFLVHGSILGARCRRDEWRVSYPERVVYRVPVSALSPAAA